MKLRSLQSDFLHCQPYHMRKRRDSACPVSEIGHQNQPAEGVLGRAIFGDYCIVVDFGCASITMKEGGVLHTPLHVRFLSVFRSAPSGGSGRVGICRLCGRLDRMAHWPNNDVPCFSRGGFLS